MTALERLTAWQEWVAEQKRHRCPVGLTWRARDIGYGVEEGYSEGFFTGERDTWGKRTFQVYGGPALYLFDDEIQEVAR